MTIKKQARKLLQQNWRLRGKLFREEGVSPKLPRKLKKGIKNSLFECYKRDVSGEVEE